MNNNDHNYKNKKGLKIFFPFRAFHNQEFNARVMTFFLLPPIFNLIILLFLNDITTFWGQLFQFFLAKMGYANSVSYLHYHILNFSFLLPYTNFSAGAPSGLNWWLTLVFSSLIFVLSFFIPVSHTPLKYFLRAFLFIVFSSLIYFAISPKSFPYSLELFTQRGLLQILALLFAIPWIYAFTYYMFSYKFYKKILITSLVLLFFIVAGPLQYLVNAYLLYIFSLLFMPAIYIYFGLLIDIFIIVAFYGYGVSLEQVLPKFTSRQGRGN